MERGQDGFPAAVGVKIRPRAEVTGAQSLTPCGEMLCSPERTPGMHLLSMETLSPGEEFNQGRCNQVEVRMFTSSRATYQTQDSMTTSRFISLLLLFSKSEHL